MLGTNPALLTPTIAESVNKLESDGREGPLKKGRMRFIERSPFGDTADIGENKSIRNVALIRITSRNKRIYPREVLEAAMSKFEGARVFVNHRDPDSTQPHDIEKLCGQIKGVYFDSQKNALMARELIPCGASAHVLEQTARTAPTLCGLSGDMDGEGEKTSNGWLKVTNIAEVNSVDLVSRPGSTSNLFESEAIMEGDVADQVAKDEEDTKLNRIWNSASSLISSQLWAYSNPGMARSKRVARMIELAQEFIDLIKPMASLKESEGDSVRTPGDARTDSPPNMQENSEMDIKTLTLANLTEARPDLIKSIQEAAANKDAIAAEKTRADAAEAKVKELEGKLNAIAVKEAAFKLATEACDEKKLPAAARTPVFMESLVRAGEKPAMLTLIEDRMVGFTAPRPDMNNPEKHAAGGDTGATGGVTQDEVNKLLGV